MHRHHSSRQQGRQACSHACLSTSSCSLLYPTCTTGWLASPCPWLAPLVCGIVAVLQQFSLVIPAGRMVALVGESGSGKSSVVSLLQRFYDPQGGAVLLDGRDMRTLQLRWLRSQMGLVSQEPALFAANIRDNIAMGLPRATDEQIIQAATAANAYGFILKLPQGLHTMVGERGAALSGGQKQRIAIARALLRNPKVRAALAVQQTTPCRLHP